MDRMWNLVHLERAALIDDLRRLGAGDWQRKSLCSGWSVQDVVAHLLDSARTTRLSFLVGMARARFDFDRQNQAGVESYRTARPADLIQGLEEVVDRTSGPPQMLAPLASRIVEELAHGEDIRRPLGLQRRYEPDALTAAITYQASTSRKFGGAKEDVSEVRLVADDIGWEHGTGLDITGPAVEILMLVTGRPPRAGSLSGPGLLPR
ncbi:maleylpyruvate isomerase family mycothiol-dependent enzyme [Dietzia sp. SLG310A2-38A2]|uniref:maleylpyruvate isomerase family mycothiol-dependent enzyme n=1 Tax=Dietzia sp. SLG310A2-38A2 TaxID=1630643 RepID=UPI0019D53C55|nr:maleylpyruvate isomerase family mycothiol-dependent enzyme [Dietzia sp. SLG310A2-38A2]